MKQNILLLVLLAACASLGFWFNKHFEFYQETIDLGWSAKARANEFLAAEQYLRKLEFEVDSGDRIRDFSGYSKDATLVLADSGMILSERQLQKLLDWLATGGHLVVGAAYSQEGDSQNSDLLMQYLGLSRVDDYCDCEKPSDDSEDFLGDSFDAEQLEKSLQDGKKLSELLREKNRLLREKKKSTEGIEPSISADENTDAEVAEESAQTTPSYDPEEITKTRWADYDADLQLYFSEHSKLQHSAFADTEDSEENHVELSGETGDDQPQPFYWSSNKHGVQLVQFYLGEGLITVVSQSDIWHSENIQQLDHALQLWLLVNTSEQVTFLFGTQMPGLLELIWRHAAELLSAILLLLSAWLWHCSYRFGRPQQLAYRQRRSLLEHIFACANLLWREKHSEALLEPLRTDTRQLFSRRHPAFHGCDERELFTAIAHICSLPEESVSYAFTHSAGEREREFQFCVKTLQNIRDNL